MILSSKQQGDGSSAGAGDASGESGLASGQGALPYRPDAVDRLIAEWHQEIPELDTSAKEVIYRIFRVRDRLQEMFLDDLKKVGLNDASFHLLTALRRSGEPYRLAPTELTKRYLTVTSGGVTQLIDRLSAKGLVVRQHNAEDRRGVFVKLTDAGLELINKVIIARVEHEQRVLFGLSDADRETLTAILHRLLDTLEP